MAETVFELAPLAAWLAGHVDGFRGPLQVEQFSGGQSNPTFLLRTPATGATCCASKPAGRAAAVGARGRPRVPRDDGARRHRRAGAAHVLLLRRRSGHRHAVLRDGIRRRPHLLGSGAAGARRGRARAALWDDINRWSRALHSVDYAAIGLGDYGKPGNYFERQIGRWTQAVPRVGDRDRSTAMDRLIDWLPAQRPPRTTRPRSSTATSASTT